MKRSVSLCRSLPWFGLSALASVLAAACVAPSTAHDGGAVPSAQSASAQSARADKIDLLFAIDNSPSMRDKQVLLRHVVPTLIARFATPDCLDAAGAKTGTVSTLDAAGLAQCPSGQTLEFPAVQDIHVGIISSSLGARGSDTCSGAHGDDRAHLLNRTLQPTPAQFLAWRAPTPQNQAANQERGLSGAVHTNLVRFVDDVDSFLAGVGEDGCGYEAQLESVYRFLVQPDPYDRIRKDGDAVSLDGTDSELLRQRSEFLRPDSLLGVIMLTDENESSVAPTALGGQGWIFEDTGRHMRPGSATCEANPNDPACTSCFLATSSASCAPSLLDDQTDNPNLRFFHPKQRFGIDPRYPVSRYVHGFTSNLVPHRGQEYDALTYVGNEAGDCQNPLFASNLPVDQSADLCHLPAGPRTPDKVFFSVIGGVPWQLLTEDPNNLSASFSGRTFKDRLTDADYTHIIGRDPLNYDFTDAHPLMLESAAPRSGAGVDQAHGREFDTGARDLQYACTFALPAPVDCTNNQTSCDCDRPTDSPLCDSASPTTQVRGKAYPSINQLAVARGLGEQAVVASICPVETVDTSSPLYGYRPATAAIVSRMARALK